MSGARDVSATASGAVDESKKAPLTGEGGLLRVALVGVGLIGGSLGLALRKRGLAGRVTGVEPDPAAREAALARGAVDAATGDLAEGVAGADVVFVCAPVTAAAALLPRLASCVGPGAVVTDVGSVKEAVASAARSAFPRGNFVPGHPMAGSERSGVGAASATLFEGAVWALTPEPGRTDPEAVARVAALAEGLGARPLVMDAAAHDAAVAMTSHLPHVLAYALAASAREAGQTNPYLMDLAAGSFASATRVAASPPAMWTGIALANREALLAALAAFRAELDAAQAALEQGDPEALQRVFARGHRPR